MVAMGDLPIHKMAATITKHPLTQKQINFLGCSLLSQWDLLQTKCIPINNSKAAAGVLLCSLFSVTGDEAYRKIFLSLLYGRLANSFRDPDGQAKKVGCQAQVTRNRI